MKPADNLLLTINGGSSSIKFYVYAIERPLRQLLQGQVESIGTKNTKLIFTDKKSGKKNTMAVDANSLEAATVFLIDWLDKHTAVDAIQAIGHRIVHGMNHTAPEMITAALLDELKAISAYDPEHLPGEIALITSFKKRFPALPHIACFDTSFHSGMPAVAKLLPIPARFRNKGIQRYGFHGLSYAYLMEKLADNVSPEAAKRRVILAHLGNGASIAAVKDGKSMDTSMGFTPVSGLPMSTRTGDLDPGAAWYMMQSEKLNPDQFSHLINHESGLLAVAETSSDIRELLNDQHTDQRAAAAIEYFCYQTKKWIGSFAAVLGGADILVFAGGIGEHAPEIRSRICNGLQFLGIELDETANTANETIISAKGSRVLVYVIQTNEELMIAKLVCQLIDQTKKIT